MRPTNCENGEHIPDAGYISPHRFFTLVFYEVTVSNQSSSALYVYHFKNHFSGFKLKNCYYIGTLIRQVLSQKLFYEIIKTRNFRCPKKKKKTRNFSKLRNGKHHLLDPREQVIWKTTEQCTYLYVQ